MRKVVGVGQEIFSLHGFFRPLLLEIRIFLPVLEFCFFAHPLPHHFSNGSFLKAKAKHERSTYGNFSVLLRT